MTLVRRLWFKLLLAFLGAALAALWSLTGAPATSVRDRLVAVLQGNLFVFGFASAMALFLLGNFVRGLRSGSLSLIAEIRRSLWEIHDDLSSASDSAVRAVLNRHIRPLLGLSRKQWLEPENYKEWSQDIATTMSKCRSIKQRSLILQRHLLPLEESLNELALWYIRSVCIDLLISASRDVFVMLVCAIGVNLLGGLLPHGRIFDGVMSALTAGVILLMVLELIHVFSYVLQESREENAELLAAQEEDEANDSPEEGSSAPEANQ